ncbi:L-rhamnose mutarotase [Pontibacter qinzhouensis]|uniref:L-rhamnose mutarotase n=1 Tax=Pontibacter qinzhouensis TaxID=2603253 RepID=A0A5C8J996_9BACT|nr:L-rhamnose mutarotase [Pontibacter qinzhouensis]TXK33861.1 L-rhamnose mutarotase [Pontibacter qinzhouensis]
MTRIIKQHVFVCICLLISLFTVEASAAEIWVSPKGANDNPGTKDKPLADIGLALRKAREMRRLADPTIADGIFIILKGGLYTLQEPLFIRPEDAGTASSPTIFQAAPGEKPVISGGMQVQGWKRAGAKVAGLPKEAQGKVWVADAPVFGDQVLDFRQLYVNNVKAVRSQDTKLGTMSRIISWNHKDETCTIPKPTADIKNAAGMEMFIHQWWAIAVLRIKAVEMTAAGAVLSFYQPESRIQSEHPWPAPWMSKETGNSAFFLTNAMQFLNEPGEWFLDKKERKLYYWPRNNENLAKATVTVPVLETLVKMEGTIDQPVAYVGFKDIAFQHSTWLRPSKEGHVPHQAGMHMLDAYKLKIPGTPDKKGMENQAWVGRPAAGVEVAFAHHTSFEGCRFEHMGSVGLDYKRGTHSDVIRGNVFKDIAGTGIQVGVFSDEAQEVHLPYNPQDERDVCTNVQVSNNLVTNVANEDWGAIGIGVGHVKGIKIEHNDISEVSYSGISMGWGWTRTVNTMRNNRIAANKIQRYGKHMYDVSAIYTLSAQPASFIVENSIDSIYVAPYAHDPHHWFYLYTDEGSSFFTVKDNWTRSDKYLQNANGPGNLWENNGPWVADSIRQKAGLQAPYKHLLKDRAPMSADRQINHTEHTKVVEIISESGQPHNPEQVLEIAKKHGLSASDIYQWNNHTVLYGAIENPYPIRKDLLERFKNDEVKIYNDPYYEFDRWKNCKDATTVKERDHIILTANLVKDTDLQKEYLDHHATQRKKWPEVHQGFCNANFQQLLMFKNERQLMLIISIPKGASLDELDPKTTENNPRVTEWNNLMKQYQEGIPGTKPGETWVFLKPVSAK